MAVGEPGVEAGGAINISSQVAQTTGLGQALDAGLALATRLLGNVPAAPGVVPYNPALLSADQIRAIFESAPTVDYGTAESGLAARRQAALKQQLANLDAAHQEAVKGLDGAYNAVTQQLGVAQQNVGAGFADMVRQQGLVNAQAAQGAQGAQAQAAQMAGSLGLSSVGGQQAAQATDTGIRSMIASNAIDQGLLSANAGAMSQYIGSVAPALAGYGRFGALSNLKRASMQAKAAAEAQSAAAGLEDYRRFQELGLQAEQGRADALTNALLGAQSTNVAATNQARQANVAAENARRTSIWQADVNRQETIASTGIKFADMIVEEAAAKEKALVDATKSAQAQANWESRFALDLEKFKLDKQQKQGLTRESQEKIGTQAAKINQTLMPYVRAGGIQSLTMKRSELTGKMTPLGPNEALLDASGKFRPENFLAWAEATGGNYGNVMAYLASAQLAGTIEDGDAREFIKKIASLEAERVFLDSYGLKADDANWQKARQTEKIAKELRQGTKEAEEKLTTLWDELTLPAAGGAAGSEALEFIYKQHGIIPRSETAGVRARAVPITSEQAASQDARRKASIEAQFKTLKSSFASDVKGMSSKETIARGQEYTAELVNLFRTNPWLVNKYPQDFLDLFTNGAIPSSDAKVIVRAAEKARG